MIKYLQPCPVKEQLPARVSVYVLIVFPDMWRNIYILLQDVHAHEYVHAHTLAFYTYAFDLYCFPLFTDYWHGMYPGFLYIRFKRSLKWYFRGKKVNTFNHTFPVFCIVTYWAQLLQERFKYLSSINRKTSNAQRHANCHTASVLDSHPPDQLPYVRSWYTPVAHAQQIYSQML